MSKQHYAIIVDGLGDRIAWSRFATRNYPQKYGLISIVYNMYWHDGGALRPKLDKLVGLIDEITENGDMVSLVGLSAGGSAVFNTFFERRDVVNKAVSICARIRVGTHKGYSSFAERTKSSRAFAESIMLFESRESLLSKRDKGRMMTVRAMFGDQLVPADTAILVGATNIRVPTMEHMTSIAAALTIFSKPIIEFLKERSVS